MALMNAFTIAYHIISLNNQRLEIKGNYSKYRFDYDFGRFIETHYFLKRSLKEIYKPLNF